MGMRDRAYIPKEPSLGDVLQGFETSWITPDVQSQPQPQNNIEYELFKIFEAPAIPAS